MRLRAIVFDAVETLFSLDAVADALETRGYPGRLELFFTRLLRDGAALSLANTPRTFAAVADGALQVVAPRLDARARADVVAAFSTLGVHDDVEAALRVATSAGLRVAVLSNGGASTVNHLLDGHGLAHYVEVVVGVEDAASWKPGASPYRLVLERLDLEPAAVAMVAAHAWDTHGGASLGMRTGWVSRLEGVYATSFTAPDVSAATLDAVVSGLLARAAT
ncbi:MAG: HAD-IA family hydrolase [Acidimicrobiales bacterium]